MQVHCPVVVLSLASSLADGLSATAIHRRYLVAQNSDREANMMDLETSIDHVNDMAMLLQVDLCIAEGGVIYFVEPPTAEAGGC